MIQERLLVPTVFTNMFTLRYEHEDHIPGNTRQPRAAWTRECGLAAATLASAPTKLSLRRLRPYPAEQTPQHSLRAPQTPMHRRIGAHTENAFVYITGTGVIGAG